MRLLIYTVGVKTDSIVAAFDKIIPDLHVEVWPDCSATDNVDAILAWDVPHGDFAKFPNLKVIFSLGAGVDHLMRRDDLPAVPIVRFVASNLTQQMSEYVALHVLLHQRRMLEQFENQRDTTWTFVKYPTAPQVRVGMLGLGELGQDAARVLRAVGYQVAGWSRSHKQIDGVACFSGQDGLDQMLGRTDILVSLLPLTDQTRGILNGGLFAKLAHDGAMPGPVLINAGRGGLQVEADILTALDNGVLWAASLDVFETEPLPETSPLWSHPRVVITPHNAALSAPKAIAPYIAKQLKRFANGQPFENVVDPSRGY